MASVISVNAYVNNIQPDGRRKIRAMVIVEDNQSVRHEIQIRVIYLDASADVDAAVGQAALLKAKKTEERDYRRQIIRGVNPFGGPPQYQTRNAIQAKLVREIIRKRDPQDAMVYNGMAVIAQIPDARLRTVLSTDQARVNQIRNRQGRIEATRTQLDDYTEVDV